MPAALRHATVLGLILEGLHIFCGSQNLRADAIIKANALTLELAAALAAELPVPHRTVPLRQCRRRLRHALISGGSAAGRRQRRHGPWR